MIPLIVIVVSNRSPALSNMKGDSETQQNSPCVRSWGFSVMGSESGHLHMALSTVPWSAPEAMDDAGESRFQGVGLTHAEPYGTSDGTFRDR